MPGYATINPLGQLGSAIVMFFVLGFLPAFLISKLLAKFDVLHIPAKVELESLDHHSELAYQQALADVASTAKAIATKM